MLTAVLILTAFTAIVQLFTTIGIFWQIYAELRRSSQPAQIHYDEPEEDEPRRSTERDYLLQLTKMIIERDKLVDPLDE